MTERPDKDQPEKKKKKKGAGHPPPKFVPAEGVPRTIPKGLKRSLNHAIKTSIEAVLGEDEEYQAVQEAVRESRRKIHYARLGQKWRTKSILQRTRSIEKSKRELAAYRETEAEHTAKLGKLLEREAQIVDRTVARISAAIGPVKPT